MILVTCSQIEVSGTLVLLIRGCQMSMCANRPLLFANSGLPKKASSSVSRPSALSICVNSSTDSEIMQVSVFHLMSIFVNSSTDPDIRQFSIASLSSSPCRSVHTVLEILTFGSFELHHDYHHNLDIRIRLVHKTCRCHRSLTLIIILSSSYDHHYMIIILSSSSSSFIIVHNLT